MWRFEKKLKMKVCPVMNDNTDEIEVLEWVNAPRKGVNKAGKANFQLELGLTRYPVKVVVLKLIDAIIVCRTHQSNYEWKNIMRKIDLLMSDGNTTRIICCDFGATLDLMSAEKDNSSVNNHAVICILLVNYNFRRVKFKRKGPDGVMIDDETVVSDCDKWIFVGATLSKGKKKRSYLS
jgi:hypothetical protein